MAKTTKSRPIPESRARAAMKLANMVLDHEDGVAEWYGPHDPETCDEVAVGGEQWAQWLKLAHAAASIRKRKPRRG
jgi:hypothetical protein